MIIISDCVRDNLDEGCIKVASTLSKKIRNMGNTLVATNVECSYADYELSTDKLFASQKLYSVISEMSGDILYIPFASNTLGSAIRILLLAKKSGRMVNVIFSLRWHMNIITRAMLSMSKCRVITLSQDSFEYFKKQLKSTEIVNIKTGVDTEKFNAVDETRKKELRQKYNLPLDKPIVLHVGHLKHGRNIDVFLDLEDSYHGVLVFSSVTEKDSDLKKKLVEKSNITIIENYIENIEEIYQASDYYLFPVEEENNSIDIPLSVLEACSCNIKVLTTGYKEIAYFPKVEGISFLEKGKLWNINEELNNISMITQSNTRTIAEEYDWKNSIDTLKHYL